MNNLKKINKYQLVESKMFLLKFWFIMLSINLISYAINFYAKHGVFFGIYNSIYNGDGLTEYISIAGANIMFIIISIIVYNYENYYKRLPIVLSFSTTRREFFKAITVNNLLIASIFSIIQGILMKLDPIIIKLIGRNPTYEFIFINTDKDNVIFIIFSLFILFLLVASICNLIASLNYKFGGKLWIALILLNIVFSNIRISRISLKSIIKDFTFNLGNMFQTRIDLLQVFTVVIMLIVSMYTVAYFVTINTNIKQKKS